MGRVEADWVTTSTILAELQTFSDSRAWTRFAARFRTPVVRYARRLGLGADAAEDAAQETLLAFAASYREGKFDVTRGRLSDWLFGIATRQVRSVLAKDRRHREQAQIDQEALNEIADPEASKSWDQEWERALFEQCVERLRRETASITFRAFELSVRAGRPAAEVARELGVSIKSVYNAKHRVLQRIRQLRAELESID